MCEINNNIKECNYVRNKPEFEKCNVFYAVEGDSSYISFLKCSICLDTFKAPVNIDPCNHACCEECFKGLEECPKCKKEIKGKTKASTDLEDMAKAVKVECRCCESWTGTREESMGGSHSKPKHTYCSLSNFKDKTAALIIDRMIKFPHRFTENELDLSDRRDDMTSDDSVKFFTEALPKVIKYNKITSLKLSNNVNIGDIGAVAMEKMFTDMQSRQNDEKDGNKEKGDNNDKDEGKDISSLSCLKLNNCSIQTKGFVSILKALFFISIDEGNKEKNDKSPLPYVQLSELDLSNNININKLNKKDDDEWLCLFNDDIYNKEDGDGKLKLRRQQLLNLKKLNISNNHFSPKGLFVISKIISNAFKNQLQVLEPSGQPKTQALQDQICSLRQQFRSIEQKLQSLQQIVSMEQKDHEEKHQLQLVPDKNGNFSEMAINKVNDINPNNNVDICTDIDIDLSGCNLKDKGVITLTNELINNTCCCFNCHCCCVSSFCKNNFSRSLSSLNLSNNNITDRGVSHLSNAISKCCCFTRSNKLQCLFLGDNKITDVGASKITEAIIIGKCFSLQTIDLSNNKLGDKGAIIIADELISLCKGLKLINLSANEIGDEGVSAIAATISELQFLTEFYLGDNNITDKSAILLADALSKCLNLRFSDVKNNNNRSNGVKSKIYSSIKEHPQERGDIKPIDSNNKEIGSEGYKAIADDINTSQSEQIPKEIISKIYDEKEKCDDLKILLSSNDIYLRTICMIDLKNQNLTEEDVIKMSKTVLPHCDNLTKLCLEGNEGIGDEGAVAIADALPKMGQLVELNLGNNNIWNHGAFKLAEAITKSSSFELNMLNLKNNDIRSNGVKAIISSLLKKQQLNIKLDLTGNKYIGDEGYQAIKDAIDMSKQQQNNQKIISILYDEKKNSQKNNNKYINREVTNSDIRSLLSSSENYLRTVTKIDLRNNDITKENLIEMSESVLPRCENLTELLFANIISFDDDCAIAISNVLPRLKHLTKLWIISNNITDLSVMDMTKTLPHNMYLSGLGLCGSKFSDEGAVAIAKVLPQLEHLTAIYLWGNKFTDRGAVAIANVLPECSKCLSSLQLPDKTVGEEGRKIINEVPVVRDGKVKIVYYE